MFKKLEKIRFNSFKGFIGSIGDDLPSLIPLFFALMIFFSALSFAFMTINNRNATLNTYVDSLTIARSAMGQGSYYDLNDFLSSQKQIATMSNYFYGLVYMSKDAGSNFGNIFSSGDLKSMFIQQCSDKEIFLPTNIDSGKGILFTKTRVKSNTGSCVGGKPFFVASNSVSVKLNGGGSSVLLQDIKHKKYFYYMYPVTLLTPKGYKVVYLLVMVW